MIYLGFIGIQWLRLWLPRKGKWIASEGQRSPGDSGWGLTQYILVEADKPYIPRTGGKRLTSTDSG